MKTTVTLSSKGQLALPKQLRENDQLEKSAVFRLQRLERGKYLLEKLTPPQRFKAKLFKSKDGFLVFRPPKGAPTITSELVKQFEAETICYGATFDGPLAQSFAREPGLVTLLT